MAIAFDAHARANSGIAAGSLTYSHTNTGSNLALLVAVFIDSGSDFLTASNAVQYNNVSMTRQQGQFVTGEGWMYLYSLHAPASDANFVVITASSATNVISSSSNSFTGCLQTTALVNATGFTTNSPVTTLSLSLTTTVDNCWLVGGLKAPTGTKTAGANTIIRFDDETVIFMDSNSPVTPAGAQAISASGTSGRWIIAGAAITPALSSVFATKKLLLGVGK